VIEDLNSTLSERVIVQAAYAAVSRYAAIAAGDFANAVDPAMDDVLRGMLRDIGSSNWSIEDVLFTAKINSRIFDYLALFDEEPTGETYYPYSSLLQAITGLAVATRGVSPLSLGPLWEYALRFAKHVDWQLRKSRILVNGFSSFEELERGLWLRHSRLTGEIDFEYREFLKSSSALAAEYVDALSCALAEESTADYVVIFEDSTESRFRHGDSHDFRDLRWRLGRSIYIERMDDANVTYFVKPGYLYVWCLDELVVSRFLASELDVKGLVDPRRPDGMVVEAPAFIQNPVRSVREW
jgi:hypothetical protein